MTTPSIPGEISGRVVVIGAGMAGLMAGTVLAEHADVIVLESADRAGGRVESERRGDYWINLGTQFTEGTGTLIEQLDRRDIRRGTLAGKKVGLALEGGIVDTANPIALMFRTRMSLADRIAMARVGVRIVSGAIGLDPRWEDRRFGRWVRSVLDNRGASHLLDGVTSPVATAIVESWAAQWMGCDPHETAATQLVASIAIALADPAAVPNFSLPEGGNQTLTDTLADQLGERLRLGSTVESVEWTDNEVVVHYTDTRGRHRLSADRAIVTVPADVATTILPGLPDPYRHALEDIDYGRYVVVGYFTEEQGPQRWDEYYGLSTPKLEFQALFNHAAALRSGERKPGGALACFAGGGKADDLFACTDDEIVERFSRDLLSIYPELDGKLGTPIVRRHHRVVPFWAPGRRASLPVLREPLGPVHLAGDYQLDMPSLADAATSGERAARAVLRSL